MGSWRSFASKSEALLKSNNIAKAQKKVRAGLEKHPNQANLLCIAIQAFRASDKRQESLEFAELLITHHPTNWEGYGRSAQDLVALKRFEEAQQHIQAGLKKTSQSSHSPQHCECCLPCIRQSREGAGVRQTSNHSSSRHLGWL
ncbi:tetratricopeptide repeat protein [Synechococcus sp. W2B2]|uniref:tetratricopeptide repeat protein n=1 Tax=Synechococcus sp. W2B2 TaxID=3392296 RepID=UPI0039EA80A5